MNILLVQPAKPASAIGGDDVHLYEPLALEYLAAGIPPGHHVRILDMRIDPALERTLREFRPDLIGLTAYTVHVHAVRALCAAVKKWNPRALTVVGGHHATLLPQDFLASDVDLVVVGEGVGPLREIVRRTERGESLDGIPGTARANGSGMVLNEQDGLPDLDSLPFPDRSLTAAYRQHYFAEYMRPIASIRTSMGCPHRCNFCALWKLTGGRYLRREPERVVEELRGIDEEYVFFADDESLIDAPRMLRLAGLIRETGMRKRFFLYGRSDTIVRHPELLEAWRAVGLERVFVGLEFFRDTDLAYIRKRSTTEQNTRAIAILHELGIEPYASFIIRPEFTREDFAELRRYCRQLDIGFPSFAVLTPLPGTDLLEEVRERLLTDNYDWFDFLHTLLPTTLPLEEFYREYHDLYRNAVSFRGRLAQMRKYPLREYPQLIARANRFYRRLRTAHRDYQA